MSFIFSTSKIIYSINAPFYSICSDVMTALSYIFEYMHGYISDAGEVFF